MSHLQIISALEELAERPYMQSDGATETGSGKYMKMDNLGSSSGTSIKTRATGGGQAHNNMPPYLAVYCWQRTA